MVMIITLYYYAYTTHTLCSKYICYGLYDLIPATHLSSGEEYSDTVDVRVIGKTFQCHNIMHYMCH